ncbi:MULTISPECIES: MgtC/SapB family protein [Oceanobacillus]|uniref:Transporter n=1 Tax=Oceanobacillus indicireducens TaxID=1004261 RepID=A0A917Y1H9_9BACI|nr:MULTISPECIES: MgtC/SapB family protein [Oceanobacillus]GGN62885.1 transporter [Oceanobacillus indicireducens]
MEVFLQNIIGEHFYVIVTRLLVALVLSGIIGFEREWNNHSAGFRTHILVGVGASLMMLLSIFGFLEFLEHYDNVRFDPARIPSYVISGIGFLGAGTIIVYGGTIRGLTTAASIWAVAGIGLVVGAGMYGPAIVATLIILISLVVLNNLERLLPSQRKYTRIEMVVERNIKVHQLVEVAEAYDVNIIAVEVEKMERDLRKIYFKMRNMEGTQLLALFEEISELEGVNNIRQLEK